MNKEIFAPHALAALFLLSTGLSWAEEATSPATTSFDIPPQSLEAALIRFSEQSDIQLVMASAHVDGKEVEGVVGALTHQEALVELLDNTGLEYQFINDETVAIGISNAGGDSDPKNPSQTPVLMTLHQVNETQTRVSARTSNSLETAESPYGRPAQPLEEIIVTGTNIRGVENPTTPVIQFGREEIELSGAATVDEFLRIVPQNFASQTQLAFDSANPNVESNPTQGTVVDLRGLGPGSTLTLLNGRRLSAAGISNSVDISIIPVAALERVDVLTDGATAVYGSDAVGGVVNFVTRQDYEGFEINAHYGTVTDGSKEDLGVGAAGGLSWGSGSTFVGASYMEQEPLLTSEREFVDQDLVVPGSTFGSATENASVVGSFNQLVSPHTNFGADVLYSRRSAESDLITAGVPIRNRSEQEALSVNARLTYEISSDVIGEFFMDHASNRTETSDSDDFADISDFNNDLLVVEGRLSGDLVDLPAGALSFAVGGLFREEEFELSSQELEADRDVAAAYLELLIPVVGGDTTLPFVQALQLSLAARYENYSDLGDTADPKVGIHIDVNDSLSLRASFSESFRAPDLNNLNQEPLFFISGFSVTDFITVQAPEPDDRILFPGDRVVTLQSTGFNPNLQPETARIWSGGFEFSPTTLPGFRFSANYFDVDYTNRIGSVLPTEPIQIAEFGSLVSIPPSPAAVEAVFADAAAGRARLLDFAFLSTGATTPEDIQVLINAGTQNISERRVRGADLISSYEFDTEVGQFTVAINAAYLRDFVSRVAPNAGAVDQIDTIYRPNSLRLRSSLGWRQGGYTSLLAVNHQGGYQDNVDDAVAADIDSWTTVDFSLRYEFGKQGDSSFLDGTRIGISAVNLFDEDPPFISTPNGLNFDTANANPFGRQVSLRLVKSF